MDLGPSRGRVKLIDSRFVSPNLALVTTIIYGVFLANGYPYTKHAVSGTNPFVLGPSSSSSHGINKFLPFGCEFGIVMLA
jgi:hypothetical protein